MAMDWLDYNDWDDEEWNLYIISVHSVETGEEVSQQWPVYAGSYMDAITVYEVIQRLS